MVLLSTWLWASLFLLITFRQRRDPAPREGGAVEDQPGQVPPGQEDLTDPEIQIHPSDTTRWVLTTKVFLQECTWHHRYCYIKHNSGEISYFLLFIYRTKCDKQPTKYVLCYSSKYQHWVITNIFHYTSYKGVHDIFYNFGTKPLLWVFLLDVASEIAHIDSGELPRLYLTCAMVST